MSPLEAHVAQAKTQVPWPQWVVRVEHRVGLDAGGDHAVWFWVILSDDTPPEDLTFRALKPIEDALEVALNGGATPFVFDVIPYVSYRLLSEQQALQGQS